MGRITTTVLKVVIAIALAGSVLVQAVLMPLLWLDLDGAPTWFRVSLVTIFVLGIATLQVTAICIWRLLTMVRRGTVFSHAAFRWVDIIIGAILSASALTFALAVVGAVLNRTQPGDAIAPGMVGLICGAALVIAGVALLVVVLRLLLQRAVELDSETRHLRSELDDVI